MTTPTTPTTTLVGRRAWKLVTDAVLLELAIWRMLGRWIARRPDAPAGAVEIGYARLVAPVMWLWIFGSFAEVVALELVLRSIDAGWADAVRIPLLVVGLWGAGWMLGMMAALHVRRHLLLDDRLSIRNGPRVRVDVPLDAIADCRPVEHEFEGVVRVLHEADGLLLVGVNTRTNLELVLTGPTALETHDGRRTADRVGLWVDEPRDVARLLRDRVAT